MVASSVSKVEVSWDDALSGNFPENPARTAWREAVAEVAEKAKAALPRSVNGRVEKAVQIVLAGDIEPGEGGKYIVGSQSDAGLHYVVDGVCACKDSDRPEIHGWCKHKIAAALHKRAHTLLQQKLAQLDCHMAPQQAPETTRAPQHGPGVVTQADRGATGSVGMPSQFLVELHGKQFVTYGGLLAMASAQGLVKLSARFMSVDAKLALAEATAEFADGRTFEECADATPENVNARIRPHFPRMALTRAKARALRDALNISMACVEELEG